MRNVLIRFKITVDAVICLEIYNFLVVCDVLGCKAYELNFCGIQCICDLEMKERSRKRRRIFSRHLQKL